MLCNIVFRDYPILTQGWRGNPRQSLRHRVILCPPCGGKKLFLKMTMTQLLELLTMLILKAFIQSWLWNLLTYDLPHDELCCSLFPPHTPSSPIRTSLLPISCIRTPLPPYILLIRTPSLFISCPSELPPPLYLAQLNHSFTRSCCPLALLPPPQTNKNSLQGDISHRQSFTA